VSRENRSENAQIEGWFAPKYWRLHKTRISLDGGQANRRAPWSPLPHENWIAIFSKWLAGFQFPTPWWARFIWATRETWVVWRQGVGGTYLTNDGLVPCAHRAWRQPLSHGRAESVMLRQPELNLGSGGGREVSQQATCSGAASVSKGEPQNPRSCDYSSLDHNISFASSSHDSAAVALSLQPLATGWIIIRCEFESR
jgi:hypothetical protein